MHRGLAFLLCLLLLSACGNVASNNFTEDADGSQNRQGAACSVQESEVVSHSLLFASAVGDLGEVQRLLATGRYRIDAKVGRSKYSALICAIENDQTDVVEYLLQQGADPNISNRQGTTAIQIAQRLGQEDIVQALTDAGASIEPSDTDREGSVDSASNPKPGGSPSRPASYQNATRRPKIFNAQGRQGNRRPLIPAIYSVPRANPGGSANRSGLAFDVEYP